MPAINGTILEGRIAIRGDKVPLSLGYVDSCSFRLAVDAGKYSDGRQITNFVTCTAFGHNAKFISEYCTRGTTILITARVSNNKKGDVEFIIDTVKILNSPGGAKND